MCGIELLMSTFSVRRVPGDLTVHPLLGHIVSHKLQNPVGSAWFPPLHHRSENSLLCWLQSRGCRAGAVPGGQPSLSVTLIGAETAATELQLSSSLLRQETFGTSLPQWGSCPLHKPLRTSPSLRFMALPLGHGASLSSSQLGPCFQ